MFILKKNFFSAFEVYCIIDDINSLFLVENKK